MASSSPVIMVIVSEAERPGGGERRPRSDGVANRERLLSAAAVAVRRDGYKIPLATIAADAGVGVGTLYRHYASREALLAALICRSFQWVLDAARAAADSESTAIESLKRFLDQTIEHGAELVLPMHGGPSPLDEDALVLRSKVHSTVEAIVRRGRTDGTVRADITALDIILFGALIVQPLPTSLNWERIARRQAAIFLDGLAVRTATTLPRVSRDPIA